MIFTTIEQVELPSQVNAGAGFTVTLVANGDIPFPQLIIRQAGGWESLIKPPQVMVEGNGRYHFPVPPEAYHVGIAYLQIEGCRVENLDYAAPHDWIKMYCEVQVSPALPPTLTPPPVESASDLTTFDKLSNLVVAPPPTVETAVVVEENISPPEPMLESPLVATETIPSPEPASVSPTELTTFEPLSNLVVSPPVASPPVMPETVLPPAKAQPELLALPKVTLGESNQPVIYFGIHKHLHQPYYNSTDPDDWDGEKDDIFGQRQGPYSHFIPAAVRQYINGGLAHTGLSVSWSGSLIEQLNRCADKGRCGGRFQQWNQALRELAQTKTAFGNPRVDFTAFGFFHPLLPLIPARDIIGQIEWHRKIIRDTFGTEASDILFPPETAFHPHIIPALKKAGVNYVIYDSIHHFRACRDYPYAGVAEGMLPPNPSEHENPAVKDWLQLNNIWAPSKISPQLLKPCLLYYLDHQGQNHEIIGIPAERYLGNEDARGGYGALQYEMVMGQIYDQMCQTKTYDPKHPPFFILHSDGDNYGGGADSYYNVNTSRLVTMCQTDRRFQLITIKDYLKQFPVDPKNAVHLEPGAWAGADNGDPQFSKWFSQANNDYSPDLNSWAVLTAFQNIVHSLDDTKQDTKLVDVLKRLLYTAETSCYWYWTGQEKWDRQVTNAANRGMEMATAAIAHLVKTNKERTGPTIFFPWIRPANPGGKDWGNNGLVNAAREATVRTLVADLSGVKKVTLYYHKVGNKTKKKVTMEDRGPYPSRTNPTTIAHLYQVVLPAGTGNIRYYVEAVDGKNNTSHSPLSRIFIA